MSFALGSFGTSTGSTGFGQANFGAKPVGSATTFQAPAFGANTSMFGNTGTATTQASGGLFGSPASTFGAQQTTGGFGAATGTTGFGGFGATTSGGSLFGTPAASTGGIFGAPTQPTGVGTTQGATGTGLFGSSTNTAFGAPKPAFGFGTGTSSGLFGQPQAQPAQTTGLFAQPTSQPAPTGSMFGGSTFGASTFGSTAAAGPVGTTIKFNPPTGSDSMVKNNTQQTISTSHQCISCMKDYENKSLEELRFEDYSAGRKVPGAGTQPGGMFGSTTAQQPSSFFPQQQQQQQKPLFGSTATTGIGTGTGLFGQQPQQSNSVFGKPIGFSQPATSTTQPFAFGQTQPAQPASIFGQPAAQQAKPFGTTSLFGSPAATTQPSSFGTPVATQSQFGFGTPQQTAAMFSTPKPAFGATTTTSSFGFAPTSTPSAASSLFSNKPQGTGFGTAAPFGATTTSAAPAHFGTFTNNNLFTASTAAPNAFGAKPATTGIGFGAPTTAAPPFGFGQQSTGTSLFGNNAANTAAKPLFSSTGFGTGFGNSFGSTPAIGTAPLGGATSTSMPFGVNSAGGAVNFGGTQQMAPNTITSPQLPVHQYILTLSEMSQTSDYPLFRKMLEPSGKREELIKSSATTSSPAPPPQYRVSPLPVNKIRPKPLLNGMANTSGRRPVFEGLSDEDEAEDMASPTVQPKADLFVPRRMVKKLQMKTINLDTTADVSQDLDSDSKIAPYTPNTEEEASAVDARADLRNREDLDDSVAVLIRRPPVSVPALNSPAILERSCVLDETGLGEGDQTVVEDIQIPAVVDEVVPVHPAGLVLRRIGYYTIPSMEELATQGLDQDGKCIVESFTVGRHNYGHILYNGPMDVANLNLDEIVLFHHKTVTVYPEDAKKPDEGEGLNRRAEITLDRVWPVDKSTGDYIKDPDRLSAMKYEDRLARTAHRLQAKFIEYRPETGSWVFRVNHFSKYGLEDSDEDDEILPLPAKVATLPQGQAAQVNVVNPGMFINNNVE